MLKKYKGTIILSSITTLLPVIAGMILWDRLPAEIATHFGANNQPDGYSSKAFAVFGLPLIMLGIHLICINYDEELTNDYIRKRITLEGVD